MKTKLYKSALTKSSKLEAGYMKYTMSQGRVHKKCCLGPRSVVHFCTQPGGLCRTRKHRDHSTASALLWWHSPSSLAKKSHPRGTVCDCPCAGVLGVTAPRPFCEPVPAQNPSAGKKSWPSGAQPQLPPAAAAALESVAPKGLGSLPHLPVSESGVRKGPRIAKVHPFWS